MIRVLFLCTGNSCRSQMAEGWAKALYPAEIEAYSAGTAPTQLDPRAVQVMAEAGVDLSGQWSKRVDELHGADGLPLKFDYVVTVCDHARETCPVLPGATSVVHMGFEDPPVLARSAATEQDALEHYRRVRDAIRADIARLPTVLCPLNPARTEES